ncbi:MAG: DUF1549 domain-containing protein, partial [Planctomycetales bacterium]|nr:DUF1549 domain-containing protein [Planctomycetales bacterium]
MSQDFKDQILESFLRETLGNESPPDLTARVLKAMAESPAPNGSAGSNSSAGSRSSAGSNGRRRIESILPPTVDSVLEEAAAGKRSGHLGVGHSGRSHASSNGHPVGTNGQPQAARPIPVRSAGRNRLQRRSLQTAVIGVSAAVLLLAAGFGFLLSRRVDGPPHRPTVANGNTNGNGQPAHVAAANGSASQTGSAGANGNNSGKPRRPRPDSQLAGSQLAGNNGKSPTPRNTERRSPSREKLPNGDSFHETVVPFGGHSSDSASSGGTPIVAKRRVDPLPEAEIVASINGRLRATWTEHKAMPTEPATDAEWCRRVYLRLTGRIPTVNELESFVASGSGAKRQELIDHLVASHEFTEHWATILTNALIGRTGGMQPDDLANRDGLRKYLEDALASDKPYNEIAFELISAEGSNAASDPNYNAAVNYLLANYDPQGTLATARTCQTFLGWQIRCVQCHHHPTEEGWGQDEFWSLNAFFRQMKVERDKQSGAVRLVDASFRGEGSGDLAEAEIYYEDLSGYKRAAYPAFPGGPEIAKSGDIGEVDRRAELARLVASSDDLGRAFVNRVWSQFFGYG